MFNQPIYISDVYSTLSNVEGVQSIKKVEFKNITGENYSQYTYDIIAKNNIIFPSLDPMIFELRFPDVDLKGRIVSF